MRKIKSRGNDNCSICSSLMIAVGERDNFAAGLIGNMQHAVRTPVKKSRLAQSARIKYLCRISCGYFKHAALRKGTFKLLRHKHVDLNQVGFFNGRHLDSRRKGLSYAMKSKEQQDDRRTVSHIISPRHVSNISTLKHRKRRMNSLCTAEEHGFDECRFN